MSTQFVVVAIVLLSSSLVSSFNLDPTCYSDDVLDGVECCHSLHQICHNTTGLTNFSCMAYPFDANYVSKLSMKNCELDGTIPNDLGVQKWLSHLDLSDNFLKGTIPENLGNLTNLRHLNLQRNFLNSSIPKSIKYAQQLTHLDVSDNEIDHMSIPDIILLSELHYLDLSNNRIVDNFHAQFGDLTKLRYLSLAINIISSTIPPEISAMKDLEVLDLSRNEMRGDLPDELADLSLTKLLLNDNKFSGDFPGVVMNAWRANPIDTFLLGNNDYDCPVFDYSELAGETDFVSSYGKQGKDNCNDPNNGGGGGSSNNGLSGGEVAGIVFGVIAVLLIIFFGVWWFLRTNKLDSAYEEIKSVSGDTSNKPTAAVNQLTQDDQHSL